MDKTANIYQAINAVSNKVNDYVGRLNDYAVNEDKRNQQGIIDTQDALMEVDEDRLQEEADLENALIELDENIDERIADIELALCELTEEEE